jgi:acyl-CoA synthetase (AMP-forming)/AMP-acid ligase II
MIDKKKFQTDTLIQKLYKAAESEKGIYLAKTEDAEFISYSALLTRSKQCLYNMEQKGIVRGDKVLILAEQNKDFLVLLWACLLGGFTAIPLSASQSKEGQFKLLNICRQQDQCFVIGTGECTVKETGVKWIATDQVCGIVAGEGTVIDAKPEDLVYIQYSSGSTGDPKGVLLTHINLDANIKAIIRCSEIADTDSMISWLPLTHDMGLIGLHFTCMSAVIDQFVIQTDLFIRRPLIWLNKIHEHRITLTPTSNFGCKYLLSALEGRPELEYDLSCVRLIYNGSEPISADLCDEFLEKLGAWKLSPNTMYTVYGLAEASLAVTFPKPGIRFRRIALNRDLLKIGQQVKAVKDDFDNKVVFVYTGKAVDNCEIRICDEKQQELGEGVVGNIQIRGLNVTKGYYLKEQNEALITKDGWLSTGDLGCLLDSELIITGRKKELLIINGQNYYPHDIERELTKVLPLEIGKVVTAEFALPEKSSSVLVFVVCRKADEGFLKLMHGIQDAIASLLGSSICEVVPVKAIPKTSSGKLMRLKLVEEYRNGAFHGIMTQLKELELKQAQNEKNVFPMNKGESEKQVMNYLREEIRLLLGSEKPIGLETPLMEYGLSSKDLMFLRGRIVRKTGLKIDNTLFFTFPTLESLSKYLASELGSSGKMNKVYLPSFPFPEKYLKSGNTTSREAKYGFEMEKKAGDTNEESSLFLLMSSFAVILRETAACRMVPFQFIRQEEDTIQLRNIDLNIVLSDKEIFTLFSSSETDNPVINLMKVEEAGKVDLNRKNGEIKLLFCQDKESGFLSELRKIYDLILNVTEEEDVHQVTIYYNKLFSTESICEFATRLAEQTRNVLIERCV